MENYKCQDKYAAFYSVAIWKILKDVFCFYFIWGRVSSFYKEVVSYHITYNMYILVSKGCVFNF